MAFDPARPVPTKRRRPWLMIIGAVLIIIAVASAATATVLGFREAQAIESQEMDVNAQTVTLEEGDSATVYSESPDAQCTSDGPEGQRTNTGESATKLSMGSGDRYDVMTVEADASGDYSVECRAGFVVHEGSYGWAFGFPIGCALGCLGFVLFVIGLVLWLVRRGRERRLPDTNYAPPAQ